MTNNIISSFSTSSVSRWAMLKSNWLKKG